VLRLALLKPIRHRSFAVLARELPANLVYREFTRIGGRVPGDKTMGRLTRLLSPALVRQIQERVAAIARGEKIVAVRKMRVDTTVVETNIHYRISGFKLVYSAGVSPARARVTGPVAWIDGMERVIGP
jgi:IS5 family transposase